MHCKPSRLSGEVFHAGFQSMKPAAKYQKGKRQSFYIHEQVLVFGSFLPLERKLAHVVNGVYNNILCSPDNDRLKYLGVNRQSAKHC